MERESLKEPQPDGVSKPNIFGLDGVWGEAGLLALKPLYVDMDRVPDELIPKT